MKVSRPVARISWPITVSSGGDAKFTARGLGACHEAVLQPRMTAVSHHRVEAGVSAGGSALWGWDILPKMNEKKKF